MYWGKQTLAPLNITLHPAGGTLVIRQPVGGAAREGVRTAGFGSHKLIVCSQPLEVRFQGEVRLPGQHVMFQNTCLLSSLYANRQQ